jgi:hypothetical protein
MQNITLDAARAVDTVGAKLREHSQPIFGVLADD